MTLAELRYLVAERIEDALPMLRAAAERRMADQLPQGVVAPGNL